MGMHTEVSKYERETTGGAHVLTLTPLGAKMFERSRPWDKPIWRNLLAP